MTPDIKRTILEKAKIYRRYFLSMAEVLPTIEFFVTLTQDAKV